MDFKFILMLRTPKIKIGTMNQKREYPPAVSVNLFMIIEPKKIGVTLYWVSLHGSQPINEIIAVPKIKSFFNLIPLTMP